MGAAARITPLFARESTAARLLDMDVAEFRRLVSAGALPRPNPNHQRWSVEELKRAMEGEKIGGLDDVQW